MYLAANSTFLSAPLFVNQKFSLYVWEHKFWMFYSGGEEQWSVIFSLLMCVIFFLHKSISTKCFYPNNILVLVSINISHETIYNTVNDIKYVIRSAESSFSFLMKRSLLSANASNCNGSSKLQV